MTATGIPLFVEGTQGFVYSSTGNHTWPTQLDVSVTGRFENLSTNNYWWQKKRKGLATQDVGSNWTAFKSDFEPSTHHINVICRLSGGVYHGYRGPLLVGHDSRNFDETDYFNLPIGYTDEPNLIGLGTTAIARVLPTNPLSDLPTAVGELLSEGLPGLPGRALLPRNFSRNSIPGEYLGYEFGIKPFLSDLGKFRDAVLDAEKLIAQYVRDSGKVIRRRYEFPEHSEVISTVYPPTTGYEKYLGGLCNSDLEGYLTLVLDGSPGELTDVITRHKKTWFSGAFTYYLPPVGDSWSTELFRQEAILRHLYGGLSVETAWNLLPYSWAADWFTNAGDLIHNLNAFAQDGLVMPFGYIMERCEFHSTRTVRGATIGRAVNINGVDTGGNAIPHVLPDVSSTYSAVYLRRRRATPFGFGLNVDDFTNRQKAITAALLSR